MYSVAETLMVLLKYEPYSNNIDKDHLEFYGNYGWCYNVFKNITLIKTGSTTTSVGTNGCKNLRDAEISQFWF